MLAPLGTTTAPLLAVDPGTIGALLVATALGVLSIVPAVALLYRLDQKGLLPEEGAA